MIRPATVEEHDYCRATWLGGMLRGTKASTAKRDRTRATIDRLLARERVLVDARPGERPEDVVGWCCFTPLASTAVLHYVYTRRIHGRGEARTEMRFRGIARDLVTAAGVDLARVVPYTHATDCSRAVLARTGVRATLITLAEVLVA